MRYSGVKAPQTGVVERIKLTIMDTVLPIFICVVLPVSIVLIIGLVRSNETNRKAEVMLKAIEAGQSINPDFLKTANRKKSIKKDLLEKLNGACITGLMGITFLLIFFFGRGWSEHFFPTPIYLLAGAVMLAVGIGLLLSYFVGKKLLATEIEAEEKNLGQQE